MPRSTTDWPPSTPPPRPGFIPTTGGRIVRALEVIELTGRPISDLQVEHDRPAPPSVPVFALELPRASLHDRINRRVVQFFDAGLVDEVRRAASRRPTAVRRGRAGDRLPRSDRHAGRRSDPRARRSSEIQARTRQFAKRQATWFRGLEEVRVPSVAPDDEPEAIADRSWLPRIEAAANLGQIRAT